MRSANAQLKGKHTALASWKAETAVSILGFGGHHLGDVEDFTTAEKIVNEAVHGGATCFDNCWEYHREKSAAAARFRP